MRRRSGHESGDHSVFDVFQDPDADVRVEIDGADEEAAFEGMKAFFEENL